MEGMELCECEQGLNSLELECKGKSKIEIKVEVEASLTYNEDNPPSTA
jgi:hypothetical protein